jgi:hypothetical protein
VFFVAVCRRRSRATTQEPCNDTGAVQRRRSRATTQEPCNDAGAVQRRRSRTMTQEPCNDAGGVQRRRRRATTQEPCNDAGAVQRRRSRATTQEPCNGAGVVHVRQPINEANLSNSSSKPPSTTQSKHSLSNASAPQCFSKAHTQSWAIRLVRGAQGVCLALSAAKHAFRMALGANASCVAHLVA